MASPNNRIFRVPTQKQGSSLNQRSLVPAPDSIASTPQTDPVEIVFSSGKKYRHLDQQQAAGRKTREAAANVLTAAYDKSSKDNQASMADFSDRSAQVGQDYDSLMHSATHRADAAARDTVSNLYNNIGQIRAGTAATQGQLQQDLNTGVDRMDAQYGRTGNALDAQMGAATDTLRSDLTGAVAGNRNLMAAGTGVVRSDYDQAQDIAQSGLLDRRASLALQGMQAGQNAAASQQFAQARAAGGGGLAMRNAAMNAGNLQAQLAGAGAMARAQEAAAGYGQMGQAAAQRGAATADMVRAQAQTRAQLEAQRAAQSADMSSQAAMRQSQLGQDQAQQEMAARMQQSGRTADATMRGSELQSQARQQGLAIQATQAENNMRRQQELGVGRIADQTAMTNAINATRMQNAQNRLQTGANIANVYSQAADDNLNYASVRQGGQNTQFANRTPETKSVFERVGDFFSDERLKKNVDRSMLRPTIEKILDNLDATTFEYKDPAHGGEGPQTGVMAQSLQRTPEGASVVVETKDGLMLDGGKVAALALAALKTMNERLHEIEERTGVVREDEETI